MSRSPAENFSDSDWNDVLTINLNAVWVLCRDVGRYMLSKRQQPGVDPSQLSRGKIINIASLLSFQGGFTVPAYAAAKHAVIGVVSLNVIFY